MLLVFLLAGITLKLSDYSGEKGSSLIAYSSATLSAFLLGVLATQDEFSSSMVFGIIIGVALSLKIDRSNLVFGLFVTVMTVVLLGVKLPSPWLLGVVAAFSFVDEVGHERFSTVDGLVGGFFRHRLALKLAILLLASLSLLPPAAGAGFFCFDLSYDAMSWLLRKRPKFTEATIRVSRFGWIRQPETKRKKSILGEEG